MNAVSCYSHHSAVPAWITISEAAVFRLPMNPLILPMKYSSLPLLRCRNLSTSPYLHRYTVPPRMNRKYPLHFRHQKQAVISGIFSSGRAG